MHVGTTLFALYLQVLTFFLICFYVNKGMFLYVYLESSHQRHIKKNLHDRYKFDDINKMI